MTDRSPPPRPSTYDKKVGLVLQGGGALGSYQAGVYEALATSEYLPDWVAGISIGAINAAIIAGNAPEQPRRTPARFLGGDHDPDQPVAGGARRAAGGLAAGGERAHVGAVRPARILRAARAAGLVFARPAPVSYYDTAALKGTLERLVDFDRINDAREMRLSVGAVNVRTGHFAYFDSAEDHHPSRARDGERRAAAGISAGRDRRRAVLGRRAVLQHAAAIHGRLYSAPQPPDLSGRRVPGARPPADQSRRGQRAREGHSLLQPDTGRHR